jgi:predicted pyridoxine 5'-phosphate oxidase superfamily flavin-nucleotide-binding protein
MIRVGMGHRLTSQVVADEASLVALLGEPFALTREKVAARLNPLTRRFVELSPFLCLATSDDRGRCDVSPRGDPRGFVRILDDETLLVPERPGNRLADSLRNILANPRVGLLFVIPGVGDTFRVNGRATLVTDPAKAFLRSSLWDPANHVDRSALPTGGEIFAALKGEGFDAAKYDEERAARYARREGFY